MWIIIAHYKNIQDDTGFGHKCYVWCATIFLRRKSHAKIQMINSRNLSKVIKRTQFHIPVKESKDLALQSIMYKIHGSYQGDCNLKGWAFFSWKENGESSKHYKYNWCLYNELCRGSSEPICKKLNNTGLPDFPNLFLDVNFRVLPIIKLLHNYLVMCCLDSIHTWFVPGILANKEVPCSLNFIFRSFPAYSKSFVWIPYINSRKYSWNCR